MPRCLPCVPFGYTLSELSFRSATGGLPSFTQSAVMMTRLMLLSEGMRNMISVMIFSMMPFFAFGMYEKNGEPLEAVLRHIIESRYLRPRRRIYQTQNIYALLEKQAQLENEVKAIAQGNKQKAHRKRKAAD